MKRLLLTFLLLILPFQISWAVVAPYCQHEKAPSVQHFGHHEHEHQPSQDVDGEGVAEVHSDCGFCHLSMSSMLLQLAQMVPSPNTAFIESPPVVYRSYISNGPERPKLLSVA